MISDELGRVLRKLVLLGHTFNALIDAGKHEGISKDKIYAEIDSGNIFKYLEEPIQSALGWGLGDFSEDDRAHLVEEWQSMANATDAQKKLGVSNNGICLLLGYVLEGIVIRTRSEKLWPLA
jgi:hypothetical protein